MSQQELEHGDQEVMGIVNEHAHPDAAAAAENIKSQQRKKGTFGNVEKVRIAQWQQEEREAMRCRQMLWTVIQVLSCILVAALFVVALMEPGFVVHLVNVGVLACGIVAAVLIDRKVRNREGD